MKTMHGIALLLISALALLGAPGCGSEECVAGTDCVCAGGSCDLACAGENEAGCNLKCTDGASCTLSCPGGSCNVDCTTAGSCELSCPKGSCNLNCSASASTCKISECGSSCNLLCGGSADCSSACDEKQSCSTAP